MAWDLSCPDWEQRLLQRRPLVPKLPLFDAAAERAVTVLKKLRLHDVPGTPTMGEVGGEWFFDIVRALFGACDPVTKQRFIRELLLLVPKKNNKTTGGALLMLTALLLNVRPKAKFILVAPTHDTAQLAFDAARGAIDLDPVLAAKLHPREHLKRIEHRRSGAHLEILSFDPAALTGQKPAGVLVDELHVCAKMSKAASAFRQLRGGMISIPESFLMSITTQSEEQPVGIFKEELAKARAIRDGRITGDMLPVLYEFPVEMQREPKDKSRPAAWRDPANWPLVNPNFGLSIDLARLTKLYEDELPKGDQAIRTWASQHLNIEIGVALQADGWAGAEYWDHQADPSITLESLIARSEAITIGIDGGGLDDLFGLALLGRERGTGRWLSWNRAWAHPVVLQRRKDIASRLQDLAADGDLRIVSRVGEDLDELVEICTQVRDAGLLPEKHAIGIDPGNHHAAANALTVAEFPADQLAAVSQGWKLGGSIKLTERRLAEGTLFHAGQSLMSWSVSNAKIEPKGNAMLITKQASGSAKIDALMATFNAAELMARNPVAVSGADQVFL
jgi:phage terminase large subunit-like protein